MLICPQCGEQNQIGRVFCAGCGAKLDLQGMTSDGLAAMQKVPWWKKYWKWLALIPVVLILLVVSLRLWPRVERIGNVGNGAGRMRVMKNLALIEQISSGEADVKSAEIEFDEADINAYLRYEVDGAVGARASVDLGEGYMAVRIVKPRFSWNLPKDYRFEPDVSYDMICAVRGTSLFPYKVKVGHGGGTSKKRMSRRAAEMFGSRPEWKTLKLAEDIKFKRDHVVVSVEKR